MEYYTLKQCREDMIALWTSIANLENGNISFIYQMGADSPVITGIKLLAAKIVGEEFKERILKMHFNCPACKYAFAALKRTNKKNVTRCGVCPIKSWRTKGGCSFNNSLFQKWYSGLDNENYVEAREAALKIVELSKEIGK